MIKSNLTRRKRGCGFGLGELHEIWDFPFNISATAEASTSSGTQLEFAKAHHKGKRKSGGGFGL